MNDATRRAVYAAACIGVLAFSLAMVFTARGEPMKLPWYEPLEHRWIFSRTAPTSVAMDYYARVGLSFLVAIGAAAIAFFATRARELSAGAIRALGFWAWAVTVLALFLYGHALFTRHLEPPPTAPTRGIQ